MADTDPVASLLQSAPLTKAQKADLWDAYQNAGSSDDLAAAIKPLGVPTHIKAKLWDLKDAEATSGNYLLHRPDGSLYEGPARVITEPDGSERVVIPGDKPQAAKNEQEGYLGLTGIGVGALKGVGNTAYGLGKMAHDYTPLGRASDYFAPGAFDPANKPAVLTPHGGAEKTGYYGEQIGEFFLPVGAAGKAAKAAEVVKAGLLGAAQSGSAGAGAVSAGLTAVIPGASVAKKAAGALEDSAVATMANALRATKEWAKDQSEKLAPEMLERGIGGTFKSMRTLARSTAAKVSKNLDDAYKAAAQAGESVPGDIIRGNIQLASDALHVTGSGGTRIAVPGHEAAIAKLNQLQEFVGQLGPDIPVDKAAALKQAWDEIVSKAGLYGQNAMAPASEKAAAWSFREAANSFRGMLNTNPEIAALNKEASFWIGLRDVLNATKLRKVGQTGGLIRAGAATTGAAVGGLTGDSPGERGMNAIAGGLAGQQFVKLVQSPYFMTKVSAPAKQLLADALASGSTGRIVSATRKIVASLPAEVGQQFAAQ